MAQENTSIAIAHIDLAAKEAISERLITTLYKEVQHKKSGKTVALRNGRRWMQIFDPIQIEKSKERSGLIKHKGTYLITGGLGELGYALAHYLVKQYDATVALVGRTELPEKSTWKEYVQQHNESDVIRIRIEKLQQLEEQGGQVFYFACDVAE